MTQVLVTYFSSTGNTKALAEAVVEGVQSVAGVECVLKTVPQTTNDDWLAADGIIVGSPTYFGQMASRVKQMFDVTAKIYGELEGKVGAAFTTSGGAGCGHEMTNMSIITAMLVCWDGGAGDDARPALRPLRRGRAGREGVAPSPRDGRPRGDVDQAISSYP